MRRQNNLLPTSHKELLCLLRSFSIYLLLKKLSSPSIRISLALCDHSFLSHLNNGGLKPRFLSSGSPLGRNFVASPFKMYFVVDPLIFILPGAFPSANSTSLVSKNGVLTFNERFLQILSILNRISSGSDLKVQKAILPLRVPLYEFIVDVP